MAVEAFCAMIRAEVSALARDSGFSLVDIMSGEDAGYCWLLIEDRDGEIFARKTGMVSWKERFAFYEETFPAMSQPMRRSMNAYATGYATAWIPEVGNK